MLQIIFPLDCLCAEPASTVIILHGHSQNNLCYLRSAWLIQTNIQSATHLSCHAQSQQWLDLTS
jgi:hypothetical protein